MWRGPWETRPLRLRQRDYRRGSPLASVFRYRSSASGRLRSRRPRQTPTPTILDTEAIRVEARWNTTRAWLDLWEAQERARMTEIAAADADRLAGIASERFGAGSAPRLDVVRTGADRARARAEARATGMNVAAAAARLGIWLGATESTLLCSAGAPESRSPAARRSCARTRNGPAPCARENRARITAANAHVRAEERLRWPIVNLQLTVAQGDPTLPGTDVIGGLSFEAPVAEPARRRHRGARGRNK